MANSGLVCLMLQGKRPHWKCTFLGLPLQMEEKKDWLLDHIADYIQKETKNKNNQDMNELVRIKCRNLINSLIGIKPVCVVQ